MAIVGMILSPDASFSKSTVGADHRHAPTCKVATLVGRVRSVTDGPIAQTVRGQQPARAAPAPERAATFRTE